MGQWAERIRPGNASLQFGGYVRNWRGDDRPSMLLVFQDAERNEIGRSETLASENDQWTRLEDTVVVPPATAFVVFTLIGERRRGEDKDSYFDDLFLGWANEDAPCVPPAEPQAEPEPDPEPEPEPEPDMLADAGLETRDAAAADNGFDAGMGGSISTADGDVDPAMVEMDAGSRPMAGPDASGDNTLDATNPIMGGTNTSSNIDAVAEPSRPGGELSAGNTGDSAGGDHRVPSLAGFSGGGSMAVNTEGQQASDGCDCNATTSSNTPFWFLLCGALYWIRRRPRLAHRGRVTPQHTKPRTVPSFQPTHPQRHSALPSNRHREIRPITGQHA